MSHQRHMSQDIKEPHSISLKVLRLSRPSLVSQYTVAAPLSRELSPPTVQASLAYREDRPTKTSPEATVPTTAAATHPTSHTNTDPFLLSPILNLPPSFGSAYVGETFACTLCVSHDGIDGEEDGRSGGGRGRQVRDVRIEAEMKTPAAGAVVALVLTPPNMTTEAAGGGVDLDRGASLQKVVRFDLKEEGNHVLAVTVSYYEATDTRGRTRTFRKLYQFLCKTSLIVRTKAGIYEPATLSSLLSLSPLRRWILEAQLENCGEDVLQLERVVLDLASSALTYQDCNGWTEAVTEAGEIVRAGKRRPVLHPGEVEQVSFLIEETGCASGETLMKEEPNGRLIFGTLGIEWRGEMGSRGFLSIG